MRKKNPAGKLRGNFRHDCYAQWIQGGYERWLLKSHQADNTKPGATWTIYSINMWENLGVKGDGLVEKLLPTLLDATMISIDSNVWENINEFMAWAKGDK